MATSKTPTLDGVTVDPRWSIAVIKTAWHAECTSALAEDCIAELCRQGIPRDRIREIDVPGSFEAPLFASLTLEKLGCDGVIVFGVIVQGETLHDTHIAEESARGCMDVALKSGKPVVYEILHVENLEDARVRSMGKHAKGALAARTLLSSLAKKDELLR